VRRVLTVVAIAAVALTGTSCNPDAGSIFPMTIGSVWNTEFYVLQGTTAAALDTVQTGVTMSTAAEKVNLTNGKEVVKFRNENTVHNFVPESTFSTTSYSYMREEDDAILSYAAPDDTTGDTVMMSNPAVGQSWSQGPLTAIVVGQEDVTVAAGTYRNAWKVKLVSNVGGATIELFSWSARGTGNVKMYHEGEQAGFSQVFSQELTSATIK